MKKILSLVLFLFVLIWVNTALAGLCNHNLLRLLQKGKPYGFVMKSGEKIEPILIDEIEPKECVVQGGESEGKVYYFIDANEIAAIYFHR